MLLPESPSLPRRLLLAPFALAYAAASGLHRALFLRPRLRERGHLLPLIVIGSLRAGGAGKTAVTLELANLLRARGHRVGVLAYRIRMGTREKEGPGGPRAVAPGLAEVFADTDWRRCSDEAVLLARGRDGRGGARVFVTRDRERAWDRLSRAGDLDVLISDDGLMDPRLRGAFLVALAAPGERPGLFDLLPAGPFRLTASALRDVDWILEQAGEPGRPAAVSLRGAGPARGWFRRAAVPPPGLDPAGPWWILCGLGNPAGFRRSLEAAGLAIAGRTAGRDHSLPDLESARRAARRAGAAGLVCSAKDAIKLPGSSGGAESVGVIGETVTLAPEFLASVESFLPPPSS